MTEYSDKDDELRICESNEIDLCSKINDSPIELSQNDECFSTNAHTNDGTCQTLREFLKSKKYRLRYGIPIPYEKLSCSVENCQTKLSLILTKYGEHLK